jgi:hypothetical protein
MRFSAMKDCAYDIVTKTVFCVCQTYWVNVGKQVERSFVIELRRLFILVTSIQLKVKNICYANIESDSV